MLARVHAPASLVGGSSMARFVSTSRPVCGLAGTHVKGRNEAKRNVEATKMSRVIATSIRLNGGETDPKLNPALAQAVSMARAKNMTKVMIDRAVNGFKNSEPQEETIVEAMGPGGVAMVLVILTSNRAKSILSVRDVTKRFKTNFKVVGKGVASFRLPKRGVIAVDRAVLGALDPMDIALEIGAEDFVEDGDAMVRFLCESSELTQCVATLQDAPFAITPASFTQQYVPDATVELGADDEAAMRNIVDVLEDLDDVMAIYTDAA